jgi:FAD/FMN-containing dehydrogenase
MDEVLEIWNAAVPLRPAAVWRCGNVGQVRDAVRRARADGMALSVLGGGHDWAGRAVRDGAQVIDLCGMREVKVDGDVATVGGGATANDLIASAAAWGRSAATGSVGAVGMAGLTLGGGYGPLNGVAGLAADNLLSAEVVLADGTVVVATETSEADLLWALRGGGGNFGVVVSMRVRLHPIPVVCTGRVIFPFGQARDVLAGFGELIAEAPDELTVQAGFLSAPDGTPVLFFLPTWSGVPDDGAPWVKRLESLGTPLMSAVGPAEYGESLRRADEMFARDGRNYAIRTRNLAGLTSGTVDTLVDVSAARTSPLSAINLHHFHGAATRVPLSATAFGVRQPHFMAEILASWRPVAGQDADGVAPHRRWALVAAEQLSQHALPGGYPNLLTADEPERVEHAYGPNAARLIAVKKAYDPDSIFTATPLPGVAAPGMQTQQARAARPSPRSARCRG